MRKILRSGIIYSGRNLDYIAFPMGGIGAGMICLEGNGSFSNISIKHRPELQRHAYIFATFTAKTKTPRVLEGDIPEWKISGLPDAGNGLGSTNFGIPRCKTVSFKAKFPFGISKLKHPELPLQILVCGWSPFIPADPDNSSLPVCAVEYTLKNMSSEKIKGVFGFHTKNFIAEQKHQMETISLKNGFILLRRKVEEQKSSTNSFAVIIPEQKIKVRRWCGTGGFSDTHQILWKYISSKEDVLSHHNEGFSPGASIFTEVVIPPRQSKTIKVLFSWYFPDSDLKTGDDLSDFYQPWYASKFKNIQEICDYWLTNYAKLRKTTEMFTNALFSSDIPLDVIEAVSANLSIFKSPTMLRQKDGRLWCWEGCCEKSGCCAGSCTHVWNYCQATAHLFPSLERSLRETEFNENQDENGHQNFRALLPIRPNTHNFHAAADGQLGGIMKIYRDWRISGNTQWLKKMWHRVKKSLDYCIKTWDPDQKGILEKSHHNTYDIEFWGPDGMCTSIYLGALKAATLMAHALNEDATVYQRLYEKCKDYLENVLFNGEYFEQKILWSYQEVLDAFEEKYIKPYYSKTLVEIIKREGPPYQYGKGCLSDGILGDWLAHMCGLTGILDKNKIRKHLLSVFKYNFRDDLSNHINLQRPGYAYGKEGGLILCSWPKGNRPTLPFIYSDEVWTGIEYQVACHLFIYGFPEKATRIIKTARKRYDGTRRNPFDEYECGHWYGRALSSYGLIQSITGFRYDAIEKVLYLKQWRKKNFRVFFSTEAGWGITGIKDGRPFIKVLYGDVTVKKIEIFK